MNRYLVVVNGIGPCVSLYAESFSEAQAFAAEHFGPSGWCIGTYEARS